MVEVPPTEEGWFALHDFRTIDWDAWREAPERRRQRAVEEGVAHFERHEQVADAPEGDSAVFTILGDDADLLILHFRPTLDALNAAERRFESTEFAAFTDRSDSYVSVSEVSGYVSDDYFTEDDADLDEGLRRYIESKMKPEIPDDEYVSFYPMSKRRGEADNWYQLPFDERSELMAEHGEVGREYAGKIEQVIASSVGFDDHEWGVTLFAEDPTDLKDIVYEMRFDEVSARYGEFGDFFVGRRFPPTDLRAFLEGEPVPTSAHEGAGAAAGAGDHPHGSESGGGGDHPHAGGGHGSGGHGGSGEHGHGGETSAHGDAESEHGGDDADAGSGGGPPSGDRVDDDADADEIRAALDDLDIYAGTPHGEDVYATVLYSEADTAELFDEVEGLRSNFEHYGTHVKTAVYAGTETDRSAVVSIWDTASAAETAAGFLSELPGIVERAGEESGFGTMGMFYTVESDHREDFVDRFDVVGDKLDGMDGHFETDLLVNHENDDDMFIASQWRAKDDAMAFFRSDDFRETVQWGREILADQPRHVFLA